METAKFIFECILALVGGCIGASVSALGGFLLFGLSGVIGFLYLLITNQDSWLISLTSGVIFKPNVCFLGGVIATAFSRKKRLIECGKDIGRSLLSFHKFDILLIGSLAGLAGYLLNRGFNYLIAGKIDTIALTVFIIPLIFKYTWRLTKTNDCEGSSHAVPSPYRFFEKLHQSIGKIILSFLIGCCTAIITLLLALNKTTAPYASIFVFCISALSLYFIFMGVPMPATHHFSGPAGAAVIYYLSINNGAIDTQSIALIIFWGITAALIGMTSGDFMGKLFFDEGDIHIDPPAMGIVVSTCIILGLLPLTGIFQAGFIIQLALCILIIIGCITLNLTIFKKSH